MLYNSTLIVIFITQYLLFFDYLCRPVGIRLYSREVVFECGINPGIVQSCDDSMYCGSMMMMGWHDTRSVVWGSLRMVDILNASR